MSSKKKRNLPKIHKHKDKHEDERVVYLNTISRLTANIATKRATTRKGAYAALKAASNNAKRTSEIANSSLSNTTGGGSCVAILFSLKDRHVTTIKTKLANETRGTIKALNSKTHVVMPPNSDILRVADRSRRRAHISGYGNWHGHKLNIDAGRSRESKQKGRKMKREVSFIKPRRKTPPPKWEPPPAARENAPAKAAGRKAVK